MKKGIIAIIAVVAAAGVAVWLYISWKKKNNEW